MKNNPTNYTNNTGGAIGADKTWDKIGREFGVTNHIHYRPFHLNSLTESERTEMIDAVEEAAKALGRPTRFPGIELVQRNWLQVHNSEAIYVISRIINPGEEDHRGFLNNTSKQIVAGGTGWSVEMALQIGKPVCVFDMITNAWYFQNNPSPFSLFALMNCAPMLTLKFAGIGSRELTSEGIQAIRDVYIATFS